MSGTATLRALTLRPVVCVIDHLGRDISVARDAIEGRFTHNDVTLDLGTHPDWISGGLLDDEEWRIEWVKSYECLDLAHAYAATADLSALQAWERLIDSFCTQVPVGYDTSDVSARRLQNWIYSWNRLSAADHPLGLSAGFAERLIERITVDAQHLASHLTAERNHRTLELYALLLIALAVDDHDGVSFAIEELHANLLVDIHPDGVQRECSTDYHMIVLRSFVGTVANAQRFDLALPDGFTERVSRASDFALHIQRPDGLTPTFSDGDVGRFDDLLVLAADVLHRPDLLWAATRGRDGLPPANRHVSFPIGGYETQRSGWGDGPTRYERERFLILDCGPLGDGGHGHYDQLSVEVVADGSPIVVDPGRYTYADGPDGLRRWFKSTAAHNTVTVDGLDQTPYRRGKPKGPTSTARLLHRSTGLGMDVIVARVTSPCYSAVHTRRIAFVDDTWWVIHDQLRDDIAHRYTARWHFDPEVEGHLDIVRGMTGTSIVAPNWSMIVPTLASGSTSNAAPGERSIVDIESGWVSPTYGIKSTAPVAAISVDHRHADIITVIVPGRNRVEVEADIVDGVVSLAVCRPDAAVTYRLNWSLEAN